MFRPSQRNYRNVETGNNYNLLVNDITHEFALHPLGDYTKPKNFFISAHTSQDIKINGRRIVYVPSGEFYEIKTGEKVTHQKYSGIQNRFKKI